MHSKIARYFRTIKSELEAKYERSSILESSSNIGTSREYFCSIFLEYFLPKDVLITSGEIIDSFGNQARAGQQDIVLYDSKTMRFDMGDNIQVLLVEGCLATIEVKSYLSKEHFFLALKKGREFKKLQLSLYPLLPMEADISFSLIDSSLIHQANAQIDSWRPNIENFINPKFYIFAYAGPSRLETLRDWLVEYHLSTGEDYYEFTRYLPDLICIMNTGVAYRNNGFAFSLQPFFRSSSGISMPYENDPVFVIEKEDEITLFACHLLESVRLTQRNQRLQALGLTLNLKKYLAIPELIQDEVIERLPRDMSGIDMSNQDLREFDFSNKDLTFANFENSDLRDSDFQNSFLAEANFQNANLENCNFSNSNLIHTNLCGANMKNVNLHNAKITGIKHDDTTKWPEDFNYDYIS